MGPNKTVQISHNPEIRGLLIHSVIGMGGLAISGKYKFG